MGQVGFFDVTNRYAGLDAKADPLVTLAEVVPWEAFRPQLEAIWRGSSAERRSKGGRSRSSVARDFGVAPSTVWRAVKEG